MAEEAIREVAGEEVEEGGEEREQTSTTTERTSATAQTLFLLLVPLQCVQSHMVSYTLHCHRSTLTNYHAGYSMRFEALNTQMHESHWASGQQLRHNRVTFVSAGGVEGSATKANEEAMADMSLEEEILVEEEATASSGAMEDTYIPKQGEVGYGEQAGEESPAELLEDGISPSISPRLHEDDTMEDEIVEESVEETFIIDTIGAQPFTTCLPPPRVRSPSPAPSSSSEEIILFGGRDSTGKAIRRASPLRTATSFQRTINDDVPQSTSANPAAKPSTKTVSSAQTPSSAKYKKPTIDVVQDDEAEDAPVIMQEVKPEGTVNRSRSQAGKGAGRSKKQILEDELMADYIENLKEQGLDPSARYSQRELGGTDSEGWAPEEEDNILQERNDVWTRSDIDDLDNMSTSDGNIGIVEEILSKRERINGVQYLVVWEGTSMDEARWVPELALVDQKSKEMIDKFLVEEQLIAEAFCTDSESDSSEDDDLLDGADDDSEDDDKELRAEREIERKIERMSDEQVARLLAKQEELGMGAESLMLFDGLDGDEGEEEEEDDGFMPASASRRRPRVNKTPKSAKGEFPSATMTADAYDGFDVMDFERPSISVKKRTKGRKGKPVFELSDSELERSMNDAWDLDRHKKSAKKREREELRAAGLLGKGRPGKPDIKAKYKEGMNIEEIKEEMRDFLMGDNTTYVLPSIFEDLNMLTYVDFHCLQWTRHTARSSMRLRTLSISSRSPLVKEQRVFRSCTAPNVLFFTPRPPSGVSREE